MYDAKVNVPDPEWRIFETLAVRMVEEAFNLRAGMILVTHKSKDGGYDGAVHHELTNDNSVLGALHELTFIEAKMRSGNKGIGLRDFAATLVVAHNEFANTLVVVANQSFTPQALEQACRFFGRTNMRVKLVDGATVSGWVRRKFNALSKEFSPQFLERLLLDDPAQEQACVKRFDCPDRSRTFPNLQGRRVESLEVESGWSADGSVANCDLILNGSRSHARKLELDPLIGSKREQLLVDLASAMSGEHSRGKICLLSGMGGVGKSTLVTHLLAKLEKPADQRLESWTGLIDVGRENSSRSLFVSILTALLGVDPSTLTSGEDDYWEPEVLISHLSGPPANDSMCKAVARTLRADKRNYESSWDLNVEPLLAFLGRIVRKRAHNQAMTLVFHELNRSTDEILDFLFQACRTLRDNNASVLLEIRDVGYEQTATMRDSAGRSSVMPVDQWQQTVMRFKGLCNGGEFIIEPLSDAEAVEYLQSLLPGLGEQQAMVIVSHVGHVPLHLKLTADWHKAEGILAKRDGGIYLVEELERFFAEQQITPRSVNIIFDRLIEAWWSHPGAQFRQVITAATLFQGQVSLTALEILVGDGDAILLEKELRASGLFQPSVQEHDTLEVTHGLVFERFELFLQEHRFGIGRTAEKLLPHLEAIFPDPRVRNMRAVDLLLALGPARAMEAAERAHQAAQELSRTRDWTVAVSYFAKACHALNGCTGRVRDQRGQILEIYNLTEWLEVEILRYRIGTEENRNRLAALMNLLTFSPGLGLDTPESHTLAIRASIIEWRNHYVQERFDEALLAAERGRRLAMDCPDGVDVEIRGKALSNYAVTMKVMDRREASFQAFDEALEILPESYTVVAERLSNIAAFALRDDPALALACYRQLLNVTHETHYSFSEIIHAHVDIAMADFLKGDLAAAERDAQYAIKLAMDNGVPAEEARGRNILGCTHWARGDVGRADREFQDAAFASERSISHRFLWRMRTNAAGTALALDDRARAFGLAFSAENSIVTPREGSFEQTGKDPKHVTSRWYVALIAIASYYASLGKGEELNRLFDRVRLPRFKEHALCFINGEPVEEVFGATTHLCAGIIMITG